MKKDLRIVFTSAGVVGVEEQAAPAGPVGVDEVAGRSVVSLVSAGTELAVLRQGAFWAPFPFAPGYATVFEVEEAGAEVRGIQAGDRVLTMSPHGLYQRRKAEDVAVVPEGLDPEVAVFARMMAVSMCTLATTAARPPAGVVVTGLGLVGNLAAQIFQACGYETVACDPAENRRTLAQRCGVRDVRTGVPVDDPGIAGKAALVAECSGHEQTTLEACRVVRHGGEVVLVGLPWTKKAELSAHEVLHALFMNYVRLRSGWEWEVPLHPEAFRPNSVFEHFEGALRWLAEGRIRTEGLAVSHSPREAVDAYRSLLERRCEGLTVLFDWRGV